MIISIDFGDDLVLAVNAINNATIAYHDIVNAIEFGCEVAPKYRPLENKSSKYLRDQIDVLKSVVKQLDDSLL